MKKLMVVTVLIVGFLGLFSGGFFILWAQLDQEFQLGNFTLKVDQPIAHHPLKYTAQSITLKDSNQSFTIEEAELKFDLFQLREVNQGILSLDIGYLKAELPSNSSTEKKPAPKDSLPPKQLKFTDFEVGIGFEVHIDSTHVIQGKETIAEFNDFNLSNPNSRSFDLSIQKFQSVYSQAKPNFRATVDWNSLDSLEVKFRVLEKQDSLVFQGRAPKEDLMILDGDIQVGIQRASTWAPANLQKQLDVIGSLKVQGSVNAQLATRKYNHKLNLKTRLKSMIGFPALSLELNSEGNMKEIKWSLAGYGNKQEKLNFRGSWNHKNHVNFTGKTSGIYRWMTPSHKLPINFTIHKGQFQNQKLYAEITTQDGSYVTGDLNLKTKLPSGKFNARISATESWAIGWTQDNLQISGALIEGQYQDGIMVAQVQTSTPNAYGFAAEDVMVNLKLEAEGIYFWNSQIQKRGIPLNFSGKVVWENLEPYYQFEIQAPPVYSEETIALNSPQTNTQDLVKIYGDAEGLLRVNTSQFDLKKIPLADTTIYQANPGSLTGYYSNNFKTQQGESKLLLKSKIDNQEVTLKVNALFDQDTLFLDSSSISHNQNKIDFGAKLKFDHSLGDSSFYPYEFSIDPDEFDLISLSEGFLKDQIKSGKIKGRLEYSGGEFKDSLIFTDIILSQVDSSLVYFPYIKIIGEDQNIDVLGRTQLGENNEWNGEFQIQLHDLFERVKKIDFGYVPTKQITYNNLELAQEDLSYLALSAQTQDLKSYRGAIDIQGSWKLPSQLGETENLNIKGPLFYHLTEGLKSLGFKSNFASSQLKNSSIPVSKTDFQARLVNGSLSVKAALYDSLNQKADMRLKFDLTQSKLGDFNLNAPSYFMKIDSAQEVSFTNVQAQLKEDNDIISIYFTSPQLNYMYQTAEDGKIDAQLTGTQGTYTIPLSNKNSKTYKARIQADSKISNLLYEKTDFSEDFYEVIIKAYRSFGDNSKRIRRKTRTIEKKPIELNIHIEDSGQDSLFVKTNLAEFPITANLNITGTSTSPILTGGVFATNEPKLNFDSYQFDIQNIGVNWERNAPTEGLLKVSILKDLPYCVRNEDTFEDTCPVDISVNGTIDNPQLDAKANCSAEEVDTRRLFSSLALGCISSEESTTGLNTIGYRILSAGLKEGANQVLRDEMIQDIQFNLAGNNEVDSNSIYFETKVPYAEKINFAKDLRIKGQFVWDAQTEGEYSDFQMLGLDYIFFDSLSTQTGKFEDGKLTFGGSVINKEYLDVEDEQRSDQIVEWNIGFQYQNTWWGDFCLISSLCFNPPMGQVKEKEETE